MERLEARGIQLAMDLTGRCEQVSALVRSSPVRPMVHLVLDVGGLRRGMEAHVRGGLRVEPMPSCAFVAGAGAGCPVDTDGVAVALAPPTMEAWVAPESP